MIIIDDDGKATLAEAGEECRSVYLTDEQLSTILMWISQEPKEPQKTIAFIELVDGFVRCHLRISSTEVLHLKSIHDSPSATEAQLFIVPYCPAGLDVIAQEIILIDNTKQEYQYRLTFLLNGISIVLNFVQDERYK